MKGVLNHTTGRVHKHETRQSKPGAKCGATDHLTHNDLEEVAVDEVITDGDTRKCGRCFADGGGY